MITETIRRGWFAVLVLLVAMLCISVVAQDDAMQQLNPNMLPPMQLDLKAIDAEGIRRIESKYLVLFTDLPADEATDAIPGLFEQAVPQWCDYFGVKLARTEPWRITAFLMQDKERFRKAGLMPDYLPDFPTGYNRGHHFWVIPQPGNYYTRHLVLHEGTHAFMQWFLGGSGPGWYSEGMAELMGLHRIDEEGKLSIGIRVMNREQTEYWGRISVIRKEVDAGRQIKLDELMDARRFGFQSVDMYAWSWAACEFLSGHPLSKKRFAQMAERGSDTSPAFGARLRRWLNDDWVTIEQDWRLFIDEIEFGMQSEASRITESESVEEDGATLVTVDTRHSWQRTEIQIEAGKKYKFEPSGRFTVASGEQVRGQKPWPCEAGGITIRYYQKRPLGMLMAGVVTDPPGDEVVSAVSGIGLGGEFEFPVSGRLVLRINESPARMDDNDGHLSVRMTSGK